MIQHEIDSFRSAMGLTEDELRVHNAVESLPSVDDLNGVGGVLIGGSGDYSVLDAEPWIRSMVDWARQELVLAGKPTFASCFGFQILVLAIGGQMIRDHANTEMGTYDLRLHDAASDDPLFTQMPRLFAAQVGHHDRAEALPSGVMTYASSPACPVHAFRVGNLPIWATQFHPELSLSGLRTRYEHYRDQYAPDVDLPIEEDPFILSLRPSDEASLLLALFVRWVRQHDQSLLWSSADSVSTPDR